MRRPGRPGGRPERNRGLARYLLVHEPSNTELDGGYRGIRVEVAGQRYRIRTREGYVAEPDSAGR